MNQERFHTEDCATPNQSVGVVLFEDANLHKLWCHPESSSHLLHDKIVVIFQLYIWFVSKNKIKIEHDRVDPSPSSHLEKT